MEKMAKSMAGGGQMDQMEATVKMLVEHAKVGDQLFLKFQVEEDEFTKCIKHYNLIQDPEIIRLMQENMARLGPEAMGMMGA